MSAPRPTETLMSLVKSTLGCAFFCLVLGLVAILLVGTLWQKHEHGAFRTSGPAAVATESGTARRVSGLQCLECHNVLSDEATVAINVAFSHEKHEAQGYHCQQCHDTELHAFVRATVQGLCLDCHQEGMRDPSFCLQCHTCQETRRPPDHAEGDWPQVHGSRSSSSVPSHGAELACSSCHDPGSFCTKCHHLPLPHPEGFATSHGKAITTYQAGCGQCHEQSYCDSCHGTTRPDSHKQTPFEHWAPDLLASSRCTVCHATEFCTKCHRQNKPESHSGDWIARHGTAALAIDSRCGFCHEQGMCDTCHGLTLPHPGEFIRKHGRTADRATCLRCHEIATCRECHASVTPQSHRASDWLTKHKDGDAKQCELCHEEPACTVCHGLEMPHPSSFLGAHGGTAYDSPGTCAKCHEPDDCLQCHRELKPKDHVAMFALQHKDRATGHNAYCYLCHSKKDYCLQCHTELD